MSLKAFDLIPVSDTLRGREGDSVLISSLGLCGSNLFVGSTDGTVSRYSILFTDVGFDARLPTVDKQMVTYSVASPGRSVMQINVLSALNRFAALCNEGTLSIHDMWTLEPTKDRLRGITTMCFNSNPSTLGSNGALLSEDVLSAQLCVAKKKQLQLYRLTDEKLSHQRDFVARDNIAALAMNGDTFCYATATHYFVFNITTNVHQEVTAYLSERSSPLIRQIQGCEFLVTGPSNLGIFVSEAGHASRPPIPFKKEISSCAYYHPYILCNNEDSIIVYSIFDQEPKQTISFPGGACLDNFEGTLMLCTQDIIFVLQPVPWDQQVTELLKQKKVSEALELAKYAKHKSSLTQEEQKEIINQVKQQAGFIQLSELNFSDSCALLMEGRADARAVISLFTNIASKKHLVRDPFETPSMEKVFAKLDGSSEDIRRNAYQFLTNYLEGCRFSVVDKPEREAIDTALIKLYGLKAQAAEGITKVETNGEMTEAIVAGDNDKPIAKLIDMIEASDTFCDVEECAAFLGGTLGKHHYKALLYYSQGLREHGFETWEQLITGKLKDSTKLDYASFVVDLLKRESNSEIVIKFVKCILNKSQSMGVRVFIERDDSLKLDEEAVLTALLDYPFATMEYLEHLVLDRRTQDPAYHTQLANIYLSHVLGTLRNDTYFNATSSVSNSANGSTLRDYRLRLQTFLRTSTLYCAEKLLDICTCNELHPERALLYERLHRYDEALRVLVYELFDFSAAKDLCRRLSSARLDHNFKCGLYGNLLNILMHPPSNV